MAPSTWARASPISTAIPALLDLVNGAMREGLNQYPPMPGVPPLREAVAEKIEALYGHRYDPDTEVTITAGATQAILTAVLCCVHPGDEVIVLEPCYDSYAPNIELAGGVVVRVPLDPGTFRPDFGAIAAAITPRTRAIMVNSPHNPSATVWTAAEMQQLAELLAPTDILLISDEVYEHMVFDGVPHVSASSIPALAARSFVVSSFGKTYHVTGWKVGNVVAPAALTAEFRKVHQFNVFTVNTPMQHALARYMAEPRHYLDLPAFYQRKRDLFRAGLAQTRLRMLPSEGSYFQCVDYSAGQRPARSWLLRMADDRDRRGGDPAVGVLRRRLRAADRPAVFCQARRDAAQCALDRLKKLLVRRSVARTESGGSLRSRSTGAVGRSSAAPSG